MVRRELFGAFGDSYLPVVLGYFGLEDNFVALCNSGTMKVLLKSVMNSRKNPTSKMESFSVTQILGTLENAKNSGH